MQLNIFNRKFVDVNGCNIGLTPLINSFQKTYIQFTCVTIIEVSVSCACFQNAPSENGEGGCKVLGRVKLVELLPEDGAASGVYTRAVEELSLSLARYNAAIIELNGEDTALVRCALDSAKLYFRSRKSNSPSWNPSDWLNLSGYLAAPTKEMYFYRAGRY